MGTKPLVGCGPGDPAERPQRRFRLGLACGTADVRERQEVPSAMPSEMGGAPAASAGLPRVLRCEQNRRVGGVEERGPSL